MHAIACDAERQALKRTVVMKSLRPLNARATFVPESSRLRQGLCVAVVRSGRKTLLRSNRASPVESR
jgi:hypothetical protein